MAERLAAVLARCERIQRGTENLKLPEHLAERLKVLYSKCERLKHEKPAPSAILPEDDQDEDAASDGEGDSTTFDSQREAVAMTDPYLCDAAEPSEPPADLVEVEPRRSPQASPIASDVTEADADETTEIKDETELSVKPVNDLVLPWNDLPMGTEFMAEDGLVYAVERRVGQSHGSAIYAIRGTDGAGFIVKMSAMEKACARRLGGEQRVKLEHITLDIFEASAFIQTLTQVISDFAGASDVRPPETPTESLLPDAKPEDATSSTVAPPVSLAPAFPKMSPAGSHSKAKMQEPPQSLSTMLGSYVDEEDSPGRKPEDGEIQEPSSGSVPLQVPKAQTAFGAKIRAAARMAKATVFPEKDPICPEPDEELPAAPPQLAAAETPPEAEAAVRSWDPATGQFVSEEIPSEIAEEFKRKPDLNLEDYQQRVLLAQLHDKKRRLQQQQEERERQRRKLEREEAARQQREQEQRSISAVLEAYAQELAEAERQAPTATAPSIEPSRAFAAPVVPPANAVQAQAALAAQVLVAQQLTALQSAIAHSSPPGTALLSHPSAHLGLAAQIYAWMAAGGRFST